MSYLERNGVRIIPLEALDDLALTKFHVVQEMGKHERIREEELIMTLGKQFTSSPRVRYDYGQYNSLGELISGLCNSGFARREGMNGYAAVSLTELGRRVLTHLPQGISEALGIRPQPMQA